MIPLNNGSKKVNANDNNRLAAAA